MQHRVVQRIRTKISALVVLILLFVLLGSAWSSSKADQLERAFSSVYKDRLVAESYLVDLTDLLHKRSHLLQACVADQRIGEVRSALQGLDTAEQRLITAYLGTELTVEERACFDLLRHHMGAMQALERAYLAAADREQWMVANGQRVEQAFALASDDLDRLSVIQLTEGRNLNQRSSRILAHSSIFAELQLVVVVIAGMVIQALLSDARLSLAKAPERIGLN